MATVFLRGSFCYIHARRSQRLKRARKIFFLFFIFAICACDDDDERQRYLEDGSFSVIKSWALKVYNCKK